MHRTPSYTVIQVQNELKQNRASDGHVIAAPEKEALAAGCRKELAGLWAYFKEVSGHKMQIDGGGNLSSNAMIGCLLEESNLGLSKKTGSVQIRCHDVLCWVVIAGKRFEATLSALETTGAEGQLAGNGKEVWVYDIDETTLSNLPYYAKHGFGDYCVFLEDLSGAKNLELIADYVMFLKNSPILERFTLELYKPFEHAYGIMSGTYPPKDQVLVSKHFKAFEINHVKDDKWIHLLLKV
ncbi:chromatin assembly factor 1 subunit FSM [Hordeum vulgare]|nr:chromatin assembly factor 1 subunit FSM [Hordeum vulgare]